jgi:RNA polymerase sigma factor (sigma-70 family)
VSTDSDVIEGSLLDPVVFGELFTRHAARLHRYVARRAGEVVADDVTSETFLIAFERRARFDLAREDAGPWLFGIATNLIHRHRIAEARTFRSLEQIAQLRTDADESGRIDDTIDAERQLAKLARQLRKMAAGDRECLLLYAWAEFSYDQIAESLNIPVGTVRSRLNRARRKLRRDSMEALDEEGEHGRAHLAPDTA